MPTKIFEIDLDIKNPEYKFVPYIEVVSGDTDANIFNIQLFENFVPVNASGNTAVIIFEKPDKKTVYQNLTIVDANTGKYTCTLSSQTILVPGRIKAEVALYEGTKKVTSSRFEFIVRKSLLDEDTIESSNEFSALTEALAEVEELKRTGLKGDPGPKGDPGAGLNILGELSDVSDLPELGEEGDAYLIEGYLYVWATDDWLNVGSIQGINWKGNYNSETDYVLNDGVYHEGSSYRALKPTKGNAPTPEGSEYWHPIAIKGAEGSGGGVLYGEDTGSTDAYEVTVTPAVTAYAAGQMFNVKCATANTGAATLNVCELGAVSIKKLTADGLTDLEIGDIPAGGIISVIHNGTYFVAVGLGLGSHEADIATVFLHKYAPADGSGDATPGYNQAIADLAAQGGGQILAKGTFRFDSRPNALSGGVSLVGAGINNTVLQKNYVESEPTSGFITIGTVNGGTKIEFLTLHVLESGGAAISLIPTAEASSNFININELYITGPDASKLWDYGLYMDGSLKTGGAEGVRNIKIENSEIYRTALSTAYFKGFAGVAMTKCGLYGTGGVSRLDIDGASFPSSYFNGDFTYCEKVYIAESGGVNHVTLSCPQFLEIHNTINAVNINVYGKVTDLKEHNFLAGNGLYAGSNGIEGKGNYINFWSESPNGLTKIGHTNGGLQGFSLGDGQTVSFNITRAKMFWISDGGARDALIFADQATEAISILANPSARYENSATPAVGKIGIWKAAGSHTINIKNNAGSARTLYIYVVGTTPSSLTDPV